MPAPLELEMVACAVCGSDARQPARARTPRDDHALLLGLTGGRSRWVVCDDCGLVYQCPRPGPAAVDALYADGGYHETRGGLPEHYVRYSLRRSQAALAWGVAQIGPAEASRRALDVGCGIGGALVELRTRGFDVVGIEPDPELVEVGRERFGLDLRTGLLAEDSFPPDEAFDLAYSCHVWEHLADPRATSAVVQRLLAARGGHLLIVVPTFRAAHTLAWSCLTAPHTYLFTDVSLGNVLRSVGFAVVAHRYGGDADSELWLLARAVAVPAVPPVPLIDDPRRVQRELALVPFRLPLGWPGRAAGHVRTLAADPGDFAARARRWAGARVRRARVAAGA